MPDFLTFGVWQVIIATLFRCLLCYNMAVLQMNIDLCDSFVRSMYVCHDFQKEQVYRLKSARHICYMVLLKPNVKSSVDISSRLLSATVLMCVRVTETACSL